MDPGSKASACRPATGEIANRLVSDADLHVMFRQGDTVDAAQRMERLRLPASTSEALVQLPAHRCLIHLRGRLAMVDVVLSRRMRRYHDTGPPIGGPRRPYGPRKTKPAEP